MAKEKNSTKKTLKIAILAPVTREVSHDTRGGRNRIIFDLTEELINRGHQVSIFGTGDSKCSAKIIAITPKGLYKLPPTETPFYTQVGCLTKMMKKLAELAKNFDIIHNHLFPEFLPLLIHPQFTQTPMLTTIHLRLVKDSLETLSLFKNEHIAQASKFQAKKTKNFKNVYVVPHGININEYEFNPRPQNHFLFFGRMKNYINAKGKKVDPKGTDIAIKAAQKTNENLWLAGN